MWKNLFRRGGGIFFSFIFLSSGSWKPWWNPMDFAAPELNCSRVDFCLEQPGILWDGANLHPSVSLQTRFPPCAIRHKASQCTVMTVHLSCFLHKSVSSSENQIHIASWKSKARLDDEPVALRGRGPRENRTETASAWAAVNTGNCCESKLWLYVTFRKASGKSSATLRAKRKHLKEKHLGKIWKVFICRSMRSRSDVNTQAWNSLCRNWIKYCTSACLKSHWNNRELLHGRHFSTRNKSTPSFSAV